MPDGDKHVSLAGLKAVYDHLDSNISGLKSATDSLNGEVYQIVDKSKSVILSGYTLNANGKAVTNQSYNVYGYAVTPGDILVISTDHTWGYYSAMNAGSSTPPIIGTLYGSGTFRVTVPDTAKFVFVSTLATDGEYSVQEYYKITSAIRTAVGGGRYEITQPENAVKTGFYKRQNQTGRLLFSDNDAGYYTTDKIDISMLKPGSQVLVVSSIVNDYGCFIADDTNNVIDYISGNNAAQKGITAGSYPQLVSMTVPQNAKYLATDIRSAYYTASNVFTVIGVLRDNVTELGNEVSQINADVLYGKKWVACGDSFTSGSFSASPTDDYTFEDGKYAGHHKVYPYWIGSRNDGLTVVNEAIGGSTMTGGTNGVNPFSGTRYQAIPSDADYITLMFGINDSGNSCPIGTIDDNDNTTFYGAWNVVLGYLTEHFPFAHIGIIVGPGMQTSSGQQYAEAEIAVAKKWGIPYLNIQFESGGEKIPLMLRTSNPDVSSSAKTACNARQYVNSSSETPNYHPNAKAHEFESGFIEAWLRTL